MPNVQERDVLREPYFAITLNNIAVTEDLLQYVESVSYEDEQGKAGIAHIVIGDRDRLWMNNSRIVKGAKITLRMGHRRNNRLMLNGKIKNVEASFPETGYPTFVIVAVDSGAALTAKKKTRSWKKKTLSEVITSIFKESGMTIEAHKTTKVLDHIAQSNETDMDFVKRKAKELKYFFYKTPSGSYYFGPMDKYGNASKYLDYRKGGMQIKSFNPSFQEEEQEDTTTTADINAETGKTKDTTISAQDQFLLDQHTTPTTVSVDKATGVVKISNKEKLDGILQERGLGPYAQWK